MLLCTAVTVDCGSPPSITNGSPGTPTSTTLGGTVTYSCSDGFILSGSAMISCLATGSWSTLPSCIGKIQPVDNNDSNCIIIFIAGQYFKYLLQLLAAVLSLTLPMDKLPLQELPSIAWLLTAVMKGSTWLVQGQ